MSPKLLVPLLAATALLAACNKRDNTQPGGTPTDSGGETATTPGTTSTPSTPTDTPPAETPPSSPPPAETPPADTQPSNPPPQPGQ